MARNRSTDEHSLVERRAEAYDSDGDRTPTEHVVYAVADATGRDRLDVGPLSEAVDPDALDALLGPRFGDTDAPATTVSFRLDACDVTVHADGRVFVETLGDDER